MARSANMKAAKAQLEALYASDVFLRPPARCPIDGSRTTQEYLTVDNARAGYLLCEKGHYLRWDCCGKREAKKRLRNKR